MGIQNLLNPRSIAIVGASDRIGPGFNAWNALKHVGYEGRVYLVNPGRPELLGQKTYPSLREIDGDVDAVFIAVKAESVLDVTAQAIDKRAGGLAILSSGFGDAGEAGLELQRQLSRLAEQHGLAVCGPNCLGLLNFSGRAALFGTSLPDAVRRGGIAAVVQSGSIGIALLNSGRGLGLSHLVTSGNEAVTATADYLEAFVDDPAVSTVIVFAEQIRKPKKFVAVAERARALGKPVIVLKSGRSERGRAAVMAHTGAVAGSVEACDAALRAAGVLQVFTLDEMIETAALVSQIKAQPTARKIAALSLSGGEIALAVDAAEENAVQFAPLGPAEPGLKALLPPFAHLSNPLDLTWAGLYDPKVAEGCARALADLDEVGTVVLLQDAPTGLGAQQAARYSGLLQAVASGVHAAGKPLVAISNLSDEPHPQLANVAREAGVPYLRGTREGLFAIARYAQWSTHHAPLPRRSDNSGEKQAALKRWQSLEKGRLPTEHEARAVLESYGIKGPAERFVASPEEAAAAAGAIGFPVVLKCLVAGVVHKSDAGLVKLRLHSEEAVRLAAEETRTRAARMQPDRQLGFLVQKMVSPVAELLVGARVDPEFGPLIVVGAGGVNVELYKDVSVNVAPISEDEALAALESTRISRVLDGWRGAAPGDREATARGVAALSRFMADFAGEIAEVEINPFAVLEAGGGCLALDCVIVPRGGEKGSDPFPG
jgi:acyl-CoA synthetase (NDP forming)